MGPIHLKDETVVEQLADKENNAGARMADKVMMTMTDNTQYQGPQDASAMIASADMNKDI